MNKNKIAGTWAESKVREWLRGCGYPYAKRNALAGAKDEGDIYLGDGVPVVLEVKNEKRMDIAGYIKELEAEMVNGDADFGAVVVRRRGTTDVGRWYALTTMEQYIGLLHTAGYVAPRRRIRLRRTPPS